MLVAHVSNSCDPHEFSARLLCPWDFLGKSTGVGCHFLFQGDLPNQGNEPRSPALQADSFPSEPPGKPDYYKSHLQITLKNTKTMCVKHCRLLEIIYFIL